MLPSAYVQFLRHQPPPPGGFSAIRARARARPPRWSEFVRRLRRAAGGSPIVVWRYEDYRARRGDIVGSLCGTVLYCLIINIYFYRTFQVVILPFKVLYFNQQNTDQ